MVNDRDDLVLYTDAICNLKCRYCYIDKNPALIQIDKLLAESFEGDYYINFAKKVFPDPQQLHRVEIWGGEPTIALERTHYTISKLIEYYSNLSTIFFSTNLTLDDSVDKIFDLINLLAQYRNRKFIVSLQLSLDGPTYINDYNRGDGVTEKFTKNFVKMIAQMKSKMNFAPNVTFEGFFKPTLDDSCIAKLQSKEKIIDYFKFFEIYYDFANKVKIPNFKFLLSYPNTAEPEPHTKEDGQNFANLCKLTREIETENKQKKYFNWYNRLTIFTGRDSINKKDSWCNYGACGSGKAVIGLLPSEMISTCHNGFTALISDYKKYCNENQEQTNSSLDFSFFKNNLKNPMVFPFEGLSLYENKVEEFYTNAHCSQITNLVGEIQFLALYNQIDKKYLNLNEALHGANFILSHASFCIRDNLNTVGCSNITQPGFAKLFLNGALEYIEEADKEYCNG